MANFVKIASLTFDEHALYKRKQGQSDIDFVLSYLKSNIEKVLPDKPDLILLPECCDRPNGLSVEKINEYYEHERGDKVIKYLSSVARENNCYLAFGTHRDFGDGTRRNSVTMLDREGNDMGSYDKNFCVVTEYEKYKVLPSNEIKIFDCDFGRVGAVICFDLNFTELRDAYARAKPDLILFSSMYSGGHCCNSFAYETQSHFVSSYGVANLPSRVISPLGEELAASTNYFNYLVTTVNLDCAIVHLDFNWEKIDAAKLKYGSNFVMRDIGYLGVVMLSYEGSDRTVTDIINEFSIELASEYFDRSRKHNAELLKK